MLAEAVQTVMRRHGLPNPYEQLKALTRGQGITADSMRGFIAGLDLPDAERKRLLALTPATYTGLAERLARGGREGRHPDERACHPSSSSVEASTSARCMTRTPARWRDSIPPTCIRQELSPATSTSAPVSRTTVMKLRV